MSRPLPDEMIEVTRLTQAGRLSEAAVLLQKLLGLGSAISVPEGPVLGGALAGGILRSSELDVETGSETRASPTRNAASLLPSMRGALDRLHLGNTAQGLLRAFKRPPPAPGDLVPPVGTFAAKSFSNEAGSRTFKLYVPSRQQGEKRPLIVMLHGCTQSPDDFAAGTRMNFAAEENDCFVAYPEQAVAANSSKCWNWFKSGDQQRGRGEPALIAGITRQIIADHNIDPRRVYIAGLSAGGAAAAIIAEAYPDLYAAVGIHSGLACGVASDLPSAFAAMQGRHPAPGPRVAEQAATKWVHMPTIVFHGDRDGTVHPRNGVEVIARASEGGEFETVVEQGSVPSGHTYTRTVQRDASGRGLIEDWLIHGADHAWSGGSPSGSFTDPKGPDATKEVLRFFLQHTR